MKSKITPEYLYNGWLQKYHGITAAELLEKEPELCKTSEWFKKYAVTQAQHDEWYEWAIAELCKAFHCSRKAVIRSFAFDYLNIAPSIKE